MYYILAYYSGLCYAGIEDEIISFTCLGSYPVALTKGGCSIL